MLLTIVNNTASIISLLSGSVSVPASGTVAVTNTTYQYQLATDGFCKQNILSGNLSVSDGTNTFGSTDAINYLYLIFQALGPLCDGVGNQITSSAINAKQRLDVNLSSEGVDNTSAPYGTQQVGGIDPTGKLQTFSVLPSGEQFVRDVINVAGQNRAQSVTTTATEALGGSTILSNRKFLSITPTNGTVYWGFTTGVTTTTGSPIFKNQNITIAVTDNVHIYVISTGTVDCRIAEGS